MKEIVLASGNKGKLSEFQSLFNAVKIQVRPQSDFDVPEADETGLSFIENALIKARNAALHSKLPAVADDSGLAVDYLQGRPGIYSARYAGVDAGDQANVEKLIQAMHEAPDSERQARFICALAFVRYPDDPVPLIATGEWQGEILRAPAGEGGFGYDPVFWVPEQACAAAELTKAEKNAMSHRARALKVLMAALEPILSTNT